MMMMIMMMMMMMNCICGMVDRQKTFTSYFQPGPFERFSQSQISDKAQAGFEHAKNLSSDLVERSFAVAITTTS